MAAACLTALADGLPFASKDFTSVRILDLNALDEGLFLSGISSPQNNQRCASIIADRSRSRECAGIYAGQHTIRCSHRNTCWRVTGGSDNMCRSTITMVYGS